MESTVGARSVKRPGQTWGRICFLAVLLLPVALLFVASLRASEREQQALWIGTGFQAVVSGFVLIYSDRWRQSVTPLLITLYLIGLGWLWVGARGSTDWFNHLAQALLLIGAIVSYGRQLLTSSGATALRRAHRLADRIAARHDLPTDLAVCRTLSLVKEFREALHIDASPALALLNHPRLGVRLAALCALEFRQHWRPGQPEMLLQFAQPAQESAVRAAAVMALAGVQDRALLEGVAEFLLDPVWEVRRATTEALLWDTERRWLWIRSAVRRTLANPSFQNDGPLQHHGQPFSPEAVADLIAWTAEKSLLSARAASTLVGYYSRLLNELPDPSALVEDLRQRLLNAHTPPVLRVELARLLHSNRALERSLLEKLLLPANPAPLRLLAVEALLAERDHPDLAGVLRDLARLPNREIALATAVVVQKHLGVDLGLNLAEALPPLHSRQAAEITRRVMKWAAKYEVAVE